MVGVHLGISKYLLIVLSFKICLKSFCAKSLLQYQGHSCVLLKLFWSSMDWLVIISKSVTFASMLGGTKLDFMT